MGDAPGEAASDPALSHRYKTHMGPEFTSEDERLYPHSGNAGKQMIWTTVALHAADQLRQRVAWALAQIFVISDTSMKWNEIE